jgi:hypothetical protein
MILLYALLVPILVQDPAEELRKELEKLRKENLELRERMTLLEQQSLDDAQTVQRLAAALKLFRDRGAEESRPGESRPDVNGGDRKEAPPGPTQVLRAKVEYVEPKFNFLLVDKGQKDGVQAGYRFEIMRDEFGPGPDGKDEKKVLRLGTAEFEKYIEGMSKLKVIDGKVTEMKVGDDAVAIRALPPVAERPKGAPVPAPAKPGEYRITGRAGRGERIGYTVDYGTVQGAKQTDILYVYRDGKLRCRLRLDTVDRNFSVANLVDGSIIDGLPDQGDLVLTKELRQNLIGQIRGMDTKENRVAVNLSKKDEVKAGQKLAVRRNGKPVGGLVIKEVQVWGSWAVPAGDAMLSDFAKDDVVELVDEK